LGILIAVVGIQTWCVASVGVVCGVVFWEFADGLVEVVVFRDCGHAGAWSVLAVVGYG